MALVESYHPVIGTCEYCGKRRLLVPNKSNYSRCTYCVSLLDSKDVDKLAKFYVKLLRSFTKKGK